MTRARRIAFSVLGRMALIALVVLAARSVAYALAGPSPVGERLEHAAGGPSLVVLALATLGLAGAVAVALVWTVSVGITERVRLGPPLAEPLPRLSSARLAGRAVVLWVASCLAFALFESYVHWRAGLGWHGVRCLAGPVHRDVVPIIAALSLLASALATTGSYVLTWMRRVVARLRCVLVRQLHRVAPRWARDLSWPRPTFVQPGRSPRAPPVLISVVAGRPHRPFGQSERGRSDMQCRRMRRAAVTLGIAAAGALATASGAWAHAEISPAVAKAKAGQVFTLAVPTEEEGATTTMIELTPPSGFAIDSFAPSPGWKRKVQSTGSGEEAVVQKVTWSGGSVPTGEDAVFQFLASPTSSGTYVFKVRQTYSDGKVVDWSGAESSDTPAPRIESESSLGGSGNSVLAIVALIVGALGLLVGVFALVGGRRPLA